MRFATSLILLALTAASPAPPAVTPVAVELFTSQGCSSCPPADALLEALANQPNVIAITRPVTYWDRLGWKDTLGREENTRLQNDYAAKGHEGAGVYTPQTVVQGGDAAVGSDKRELARIIAAEKAKPGPGIVATQTADGGRSVTISGASGQNGTVTVVALRSQSTVRIGRGENGGRTIRYINVALADTVIGRWAGGNATLNVPGSVFHTAGADRYVMLIHAGPAGRIIAARYI